MEHAKCYKLQNFGGHSSPVRFLMTCLRLVVHHLHSNEHHQLKKAVPTEHPSVPTQTYAMAQPTLQCFSENIAVSTFGLCVDTTCIAVM